MITSVLPSKHNAELVLADSLQHRVCRFLTLSLGIVIAMVLLALEVITFLNGKPPFPGPSIPPMGMITLAMLGLGFGVTFFYVLSPYPKRWLYWLAWFCTITPFAYLIYRLLLPVMQGHFLNFVVEPNMSISGMVNRGLACLALMAVLKFPEHKRLLSILVGMTGFLLLALDSFVLLGHIQHIPLLYDYRFSLPGGVTYLALSIGLLIGTLPFPGLLAPLFSPKPVYRLLALASLSLGALLVISSIVTIISFQPLLSHHIISEATQRFWYWQLSWPSVFMAALASGLSLKLLKSFQTQEEISAALEKMNSVLESRVQDRTRDLQEHQMHLEHANRELRELTVQLSEKATIHEYALEGISQLNAVGVYMDMNTAYASMAGYSPAELLGGPWQKTVMPDFLPELEPAFKQMLETGKCQVEVKGLHKEGYLFYKEVVLIRNLDEAGNYCGHYCFAKDITERKRLEENLQQTLARLKELERLSSLSSDIICIVSLIGEIILVNPSFKRILGYDIDEVKGCLTLDNVHPEDRERATSEYHAVVNGEESSGVEYRYICKDGSYRWLSWTSTYDPTTNHIYAVARDCTERKHAESELRRSFEKLQEVERQRLTYISALTHDLRTPLIAQRHGLSMLEENVDLTEGESKSLTSGLLKNNDNLLNLVNRLLESYQYEDGKIPFSFEPIHLSSLLIDVKEDMAQLLHASDIQLFFDIPESLHKFSGDKYHLKRVFQNLIGNAIEHVTEKEGQIRIIATDKEDHVTIEVIDNGSGFDQEILPALFERYLMGATLKRKIGSGLGLYICRLIIERHGGTISANNLTDGGAVFTITIPIACSEEFS